MDLAVLGMIAVGISLPIVLWDLFTGNNGSPTKEKMVTWIQGAYMVLFVSAFGLLLKFMTFSAVMLLATVLTGLIWGWDFLASRREGNVVKSSRDPVAEPAWLELAKSFFPVILIVFLVRSFLVEPFKIPSGSMIPTLLVGDFILVNKFTYGIRLPVLNSKVVAMNDPRRGEVMVFRYPENPSLDYIKRVVGVPGDKVSYIRKRLTVNGTVVPVEAAGAYNYVESGLHYATFSQFKEQLGDHKHIMIVNEDRPTVELGQVHQFPGRENCQYSYEGFTCTVPPGHFFMMGDNRDSSSDSRYWGFVPEQNIVGRAFIIWWNFSELGRIGHRID